MCIEGLRCTDTPTVSKAVLLIGKCTLPNRLIVAATAGRVDRDKAIHVQAFDGEQVCRIEIYEQRPLVHTSSRQHSILYDGRGGRWQVRFIYNELPREKRDASVQFV